MDRRREREDDPFAAMVEEQRKKGATVWQTSDSFENAWPPVVDLSWGGVGKRGVEDAPHHSQEEVTIDVNEPFVKRSRGGGDPLGTVDPWNGGGSRKRGVSQLYEVGISQEPVWVKPVSPKAPVYQSKGQRAIVALQRACGPCLPATEQQLREQIQGQLALSDPRLYMSMRSRIPPPFPMPSTGEDTSRAIVVWRDLQQPLPLPPMLEEGPRIEILDDDEDISDFNATPGTNFVFPGADGNGSGDDDWIFSDGECKPMEFD